MDLTSKETIMDYQVPLHRLARPRARKQFRLDVWLWLVLVVLSLLLLGLSPGVT